MNKSKYFGNVLNVNETIVMIFNNLCNVNDVKTINKCPKIKHKKQKEVK